MKISENHTLKPGLFASTCRIFRTYDASIF